MTVLVMTLRAGPGYSLSREQCYRSNRTEENGIAWRISPSPPESETMGHPSTLSE